LCCSELIIQLATLLDRSVPSYCHRRNKKAATVPLTMGPTDMWNWCGHKT